VLLAQALLLVALAGDAVPPAGAEVVGAVYRPDTPFPQFLPLWLEAWAQMHAAGESLESIQEKNPLGGYVHLYLRNGSDRPLDVTDVLLDGVSLAEGIASARDEVGGRRPASIHFSSLPEMERTRLAAAGEPVWWKVDPQPILPGGFAEVVIRLRRNPRAKTLPIEVLAGSVATEARVEAEAPDRRIAGIAFSKPLDEVTVYVCHPGEQAAAPTRCLIDGADSIGAAIISPAGNCDVLPVVIRLRRPFSAGSFHLFQVDYSDGSTARAGVRAWAGELVYGMWGYTNSGRTPEEHAKLCLTDLRDHNINVHMGMGGDWSPFITNEAGRDFLRTIGIRMMVRSVGDTGDPAYYFLMDEPDAHDYAVSQLPVPQRLGTLAQPLVRHSEDLRRKDPATPHLLNVDNSYKPENWYTYGQLPDILAADPYYQEQLAMVYGSRPGWLAEFVKPTYVYAATAVCRSAAEPKPVHIILNAVRHDHREQPFRFATPAEKRIELYYALAGGARGFSYWWYAPYDEYYGVGGSDADAVTLWKEIGLLGAEVRTAGPVITRSCPALVPVKAPPRLWIRTLLAGLDTLVLIVVNDNHAVDRSGTVLYPIEKASVTVLPPPWLQVKTVFEITYAGTRPVPWTQTGAEISIDLGTVELTRLVLVSADENLRPVLETLYRSRFAATVAKLLGQQESTAGTGGSHAP
jgi:hypothetical protein